jgi:hypothetical protein
VGVLISIWESTAATDFDDSVEQLHLSNRRLDASAKLNIFIGTRSKTHEINIEIKYRNMHHNGKT